MTELKELEKWKEKVRSGRSESPWRDPFFDPCLGREPYDGNRCHRWC